MTPAQSSRNQATRLRWWRWRPPCPGQSV